MRTPSLMTPFGGSARFAASESGQHSTLRCASYGSQTLFLLPTSALCGPSLVGRAGHILHPNFLIEPRAGGHGEPTPHSISGLRRKHIRAALAQGRPRHHFQFHIKLLVDDLGLLQGTAMASELALWRQHSVLEAPSAAQK